MPTLDTRTVRIYRVILLLGCTAFFVLQWINGRDGMADFRVYHDAAEAWMAGESPYGQWFFVETGYYKYSPVMLVPFMPLTWLPVKVASSLFYFAIVAAMAWLLPRVVQRAKALFPHGGTPGWLLLAVLSAVMLDHLVHELHLGNTNLLLLGLGWSMFVHVRRGKWKWAGVAYACMLLAKPHFLILMPWLVMRKEFRVLGTMTLGVMIGLLLPALWTGWGENLTLLQDWYLAIREHQSMLPSANTWASMSAAVIGVELPAPTWLFAITVGLAAAAIFFLLCHHGLPQTDHRRAYVEFFLLISLIPNLTNTDTEHFLWSIPVLAGLLVMLPWSQGKRWLWAILGVAALPWLLSTPDLIGHAADEWLDKSGLIGVSNTFLLGWFVWYVLHPPAHLPEPAMHVPV